MKEFSIQKTLLQYNIVILIYNMHYEIITIPNVNLAVI